MKPKVTSDLKNIFVEVAEAELYLDDKEVQQEIILSEESMEAKASSIRNDLLSNALEHISEDVKNATKRKKSSKLNSILNSLTQTSRSKPVFANKRKKKK